MDTARTMLWRGFLFAGCLAIIAAVILVGASPAQSPLAVIGSPAQQESPTISVGGAAIAPPRPLAPYTFLMRDDFGHPARWNPCEPITWDWPAATARQRRLAHVAFARVTEANGLQFIERRSRGNIRIYFDDLPNGILGYGSFYADPLHTIEGRTKYYVARSGTLRVDRRARKLDSTKLLNLLMHEIAHIVGLGHVKAHNQIMFKEVQELTRWGAGDRAGLARLGTRSGCLSN